LRVLHVVGKMHRAGIETWLMSLLRLLDRRQVQFEFCVNTSQEQDYDAEITALGAGLHRIAYHRHSPRYFSELTRILMRRGPFDVIHSHEQLRSGSILACARRAGVRVRVAHSHNDSSSLDSPRHPHRWLFSVAMRRLIASEMTTGLSCSAKAAPSLFGSHWRQLACHQLLPYGFDFRHCPSESTRRDMREMLGIPANRLVIGHVGRLESQKNHDQIISIASQLVERGEDVHVLLLGDGRRRAELKDQIRQRGLESRFTLAGNRADVPVLLRTAMDCFLFPSLHEGLPLALIEAQAAGLPTVFASSVTSEANLFPATNRILSLGQPLGDWCDAVAQALRTGISQDVPARTELLRAGPLSIESNLNTLLACYWRGLEFA
jgi:glycosyltransferase involved in cell wall biosynthesis